MSDEPLTQPVEDELISEAEPIEDAEAEETTAGGPRIVVKRNGVETEEVFPICDNATVGRFDPAIGPIDVDLGNLAEGQYVSRKHARFVCEDGVWKIRDLESSNGTFVLRGDFERVEEAELADGDEFALGNARFVFRIA